MQIIYCKLIITKGIYIIFCDLQSACIIILIFGKYAIRDKGSCFYTEMMTHDDDKLHSCMVYFFASKDSALSQYEI